MPKILIIDDDPLMVRMYQDKFISDGYTVETSSDGDTGIEKAAKLIPDVILLDMMMPTVNGLEVLKKLKSEAATKKIPVIMLTNVSTTHPQSQEGLELGAIAYLVKSEYSPREVVVKVKEILSASVHELPQVGMSIKE